MSASHNQSVWHSGAAYESYVGRWSRLVGREFIRWLALPSSLRWLDIGCGTGALSETILEEASPLAVFGIDPPKGYIELARMRNLRAGFVIGDARQLPVATAA